MSYKVSFGGFGGKIEQFGGSTGGKQLVIRSGVVVDFIQIGTNTSGGSGGGQTANVTLPLDGNITLYTVSSRTTTRVSAVFVYDIVFSGIHCSL